MDKSVFITTFTTLFLAEFGDKTQLAVVSLTGSSRKPLSVFLGAATALTAVTAIGVLFGQGAARFIPEAYLRRGAALVFVGMGVWMWVHPD